MKTQALQGGHSNREHSRLFFTFFFQMLSNQKLP